MILAEPSCAIIDVRLTCQSGPGPVRTANDSRRSRRPSPTRTTGAPSAFAGRAHAFDCAMSGVLVAGPNRLENPKVGRGIALRGGMVPARNRGDADVQTQVPGQIAQRRLGGAHPDHPVVPGHLGAEIDD